MKQSIVGVYSIGYDYVQIVLREGTGGEFFVVPEHGKIARIKIGADYDNWNQVLAALFHELFELIFTKLKCRYVSDQDISDNSAAWMFFFSHQDFADACARAACCLSPCLPDIAKSWKKWKRNIK